MSARFLCLCAMLCLSTPVVAEDGDTPCTRAGAGVTFCAGEDFDRIDAGTRKGVSYWLHHSGFVSKILAEKNTTNASRHTIEARIIEMVDAQADAGGRSFEFVDLDSRSIGGAPFGTLIYTVRGAKQATRILHSYAAQGGVLVQVLSQVAPNNTAADDVALKAAHFEALGALHPAKTDPLL
ncbi:hypothetical protein ABMC89_07685 [Sulfitobacter sp. HNIBRBA3233]|uniref:hypothetical protein n=1 Tax=Sulfitobacter marinivivus TaxID=3158558 RepID=UPI0032DFCC6B